MKQTTAPRTQRVLHMLSDRIKTQTASGNLRLPTMHQLADELGASVETCGKAIRVLKEQGMVSVSHRKGIWITPSGKNVRLMVQTPAAPAAETFPPRWQRVAKQINDDILTGMFPPGSLLPSCKEMMQRYETCFVTVKRALASLVQENRVLPSKRGYRVFQTRPHRRRQALVVLTRIENPEKFIILSKHARGLWTALELECRRLGVDLELYAITDLLGTGRDTAQRRQLLERQKNDMVRGYFLWLNYATSEEMIALCTLLAETGKPVSLLDEGGNVAFPGYALRSRRMRVFSMAVASIPGRIVGDFLLGLGHRKVACFSPFSQSLWSRNRISGVRNAYAGAGLSEAVVEYLTDEDSRQDSVLNQIPGTQPFDDIQKRLINAVRVVNPDVDLSDIALIRLCSGMIWRYMLGPVMRPLFERAARDKSITAWVCINDDAALCALKYLRAENVRVPRDVSVVGFDDTVECISEGLSSYNFNQSAVVAAMLDHVFDGRMTRGIADRNPLEISGMVIERASSGVAPASRAR